MKFLKENSYIVPVLGFVLIIAATLSFASCEKKPDEKFVGIDTNVVVLVAGKSAELGRFVNEKGEFEYASFVLLQEEKTVDHFGSVIKSPEMYGKVGDLNVYWIKVFESYVEHEVGEVPPLFQKIQKRIE